MIARWQGWHTAANAVAVGYLVAAAAVLAVRGPSGVPEWLVVHLLMLGAVTNAIVTWTRHFAATLLRGPQSSRRAAGWRLAGLNAAVLTVIVGVQGHRRSVALAGAGLLAVVLALHGLDLWRVTREGRTKRLAPTVRFYSAAVVAALLGVTAGAALVAGVSERWHARLFAAHVQLNLLGWVTFTVLGTEFSLWPTALRTRIVAGMERAARICLPAGVAGLAVLTAGVLADHRVTSLAGLAVYLAAVAVFLDPFVRTALQRAPHSPATWMLAASTCWLLVALVADGAAIVRAGDPHELEESLEALVPWFLTGFVVQVLLGALTYLLPLVLGGPPAVGRRTEAALDRWGRLRTVALNAGVLLLVAPQPLRVWGWGLICAAVSSFAALAAAAVVIRRRTQLVGDLRR